MITFFVYIFQNIFIIHKKSWLKVRYQENHTSQVWIDINTCVYDDCIQFNWNFIDKHLDKKMFENMVELQKETSLKFFAPARIKEMPPISIFSIISASDAPLDTGWAKRRLPQWFLFKKIWKISLIPLSLATKVQYTIFVKLENEM